MNTRILTKISDYRLTVLLCLCVVLGGTAQWVMTFKVPLYLCSLVFIGWILTTSERHPLRDLLCAPLIVFFALPLLYVLYLVPLPSGLWSGLASKEQVVAGYNILGMPLPAAPLSISSEKTFLSLFAFLPVAAIILITRLSSNAAELKTALRSLPFIALGIAVLGCIQALVGGDALRFYENFTEGRPVSIFSNTNHLGTFLAIMLPFALIALLASHRKVDRQAAFQKRAVAGMVAIILIATALLTKSSAGYILIILSLVLGVLWLKKTAAARNLTLLFLGFGLLVFIADFFIFSGEFVAFINKFSNTSGSSRLEIFKTTGVAIQNGGLFGYGPGSFRDVYKTFEGTDRLTRGVVNEAHNDYLQLWFELGYLGLAWMIAMAGVFFFQLRKLWAVKHRRRLYETACVIGLLLIALHSMADYPLRTISIAALACFFLTVLSNLDRTHG